MKTAFLSCFLALIGLSSLQAQFPYPYEPMVVEDAHWIVKQGYYGPYQGWIEYYDYFLQGDTFVDTAFVVDKEGQVLDTVNQLVYTNLYRRRIYPTNDLPPAPRFVNYSLSDPTYQYGWLREDTIYRKIYALQWFQGTRPTERLLYDFSLGAGDTLQPEVTLLNDHYRYVVDSVSQESAWGKLRSTIFLSSVDLWGGDEFISLWEGVGNYHGLMESFGPEAIGQTIRRNLIDYCIGDDSTCGIAVLPIVNSKEDLLPSNWQVFPNPASDELTLRFPDWRGGSSYDLLWTDALGRVCKSAQLTAAEQRFSISELPPGWYVLELRREGQLLGRQKVVVE